MTGWAERWHTLSANLVHALGRFPVSVVALGLFALLVNLHIAGIVSLADGTIVHSCVALVGCALLAASVVLFGQRLGQSPALRNLVALALGAAVGLALWYWDKLGVAFPALLAATILTVPLAPYLRAGRSGFWQFVWQLAWAGVLAGIALVVFCAGLSAIVASVDYLFEVRVASSIYGHIWSIGLGFVAPLFALSLVPTAFPQEDTPQRIDILVLGVRVLSDFVAVPLLAAYAAILHLYVLKIVAAGALPKGQIGWMVLCFGLAVLATRIAVHPMGGIARAPTRLFLRFWAAGLVIPLVLLVMAIRERVAAYGVTPERYGLALFAAFLALVLVAQLLPRLRGDIRVLAGLGALALFLGSFGPWGMFETSARSQMARLMTILSSTGALQDGRLADRPHFSREAAIDIRSIIGVLTETAELERLRPLLAGRTDDPYPGLAQAAAEWEVRQRFWKAFHVEDLAGEGSFRIYAGGGAAAIDGFDLVISGLAYPFSPSPRSDGSGADERVRKMADGTSFTIKTRDGTIAVSSGARSVTLPLAALRDAAAGRIETAEKNLEAEQPAFFVAQTVDGARVGLLFQNLSGRLNEDIFEITGASFDLYLRRADWPTSSGGSAPDIPQP